MVETEAYHTQNTYTWTFAIFGCVKLVLWDQNVTSY